MKSFLFLLTMLFIAASSSASTVIDTNSQKLAELLNDKSVMADIHRSLSQNIPGETIDLKSAEWVGSRFDHRTNTQTLSFVLKYDNSGYTSDMPSKGCQVLVMSISSSKGGRSKISHSVSCQ